MSDNSLQVNQTVSVGDWIGTMILTGIPLVGIIMIFVWAFGGGAKPSKRNYARAFLILAVIGFVLGVIFSILLSATLAAFFTNFSDSISSSYSY